MREELMINFHICYVWFVSFLLSSIKMWVIIQVIKPGPSCFLLIYCPRRRILSSPFRSDKEKNQEQKHLYKRILVKNKSWINGTKAEIFSSRSWAQPYWSLFCSTKLIHVMIGAFWCISNISILGKLKNNNRKR